MGQWVFSLVTEKLSATMQIAKRVYSLAQHDSALMIGAYRALAVTLYFLGDFEAARQYAMCGLQIWRSGGVHSPVEEFIAPAVHCLIFEALFDWRFGETARCHTTMAEAISLAKELNDMHALAQALFWAVILGHLEGNPAEVARLASDLIELSTRQNFAFWLPGGEILRGWARSASGSTAEGIAWIEDGIRDYRATGAMRRMPYFLALKAEALFFAGRFSEALEAITEAEGAVERSEERWWSAELHRLRGVFLAATQWPNRKKQQHAYTGYAKPSRMAAPSFHFLCQTALLALLSSSIFFKPILFRVDPTVVSSAATSIARLFAKDVVIRCQRPVVFPTLAIVSHVSMVGGAW
jgi:adenylate cyclase